MPRSRILVVDDEPGMLEVCSDTLCRLPGVEVLLENRSEAAAKRLASEHVDLLIADIRMPGLDGVGLLRAARSHDPALPVLMITAFPTVETAVDCMKLGAVDYLTKPFLPDNLLARVRRLLEERLLREEHGLLQRQMDRAYSFDQIVGYSPLMRSLFATVDRVASTEVDVLIAGESGTGKELVARSIHRRSARRGGRFVPVDCGAIPENLLESEFFGHERGAFTGAHAQSIGLLEFADGGTFFLDEISQLSPHLQAKLLRALQERRFRRVGGKDEIPVNVRVVAATNRDLAAEMREGRFREDLYYRIHVARIDLPPLRERTEDIPLLVAHFAARFAREMGREPFQVDDEVMEILWRYPWPGNVRELQNVLKGAIAMGRHATLTSEDLPDEVVIRAGETPADAPQGFFQLRAHRMAAFEREYFSSLLAACRGDVAAAAREAHIPRGTFYRLMKKHGLDADAFRQ